MPVQVCFGPLWAHVTKLMQFFEVCCRGSSPYRLCTGKYDITHGKLDPHALGGGNQRTSNYYRNITM